MFVTPISAEPNLCGFETESVTLWLRSMLDTLGRQSVPRPRCRAWGWACRGRSRRGGGSPPQYPSSRTSPTQEIYVKEPVFRIRIRIQSGQRIRIQDLGEEEGHHLNTLLLALHLPQEMYVSEWDIFLFSFSGPNILGYLHYLITHFKKGLRTFLSPNQPLPLPYPLVECDQIQSPAF